MPLLQKVVCHRSPQPSSPAVLSENQMPEGQQGSEPKAVAIQTSKPSTTGAARMKWSGFGRGASCIRSIGSEPGAGNRLRYKISSLRLTPICHHGIMPAGFGPEASQKIETIPTTNDMSRADKERWANCAAVYVRMSTEHQQYSTSNQMDVIREYAKRRGLQHREGVFR